MLALVVGAAAFGGSDDTDEVSEIAVDEMSASGPEPTEPAESAPADPYAGLSPAALADAELELARRGGSCGELEEWYAANPGDSNLPIARHYQSACGVAAPPVISGELTSEQVAGEDRGRNGASSAGSAAGADSPRSAFLSAARGSSGDGWPFQRDDMLVALGEKVCLPLQNGLDPSFVVDTLYDGDIGATREEIADLVGAASAHLC